MSSFGKSQEVKEGSVRKLYTGVENFKVLAVNPSKEELEKIYGREIDYDPEYLSETNVSDADGEREVKQVRFDFFLTNDDVDNPINTKISYYVSNTHHKGQSGKIRVINAYGRTTWLTEEDIRNKTLPSNMQWFDDTKLKVAKRGEEELIGFLVNLLNLPWDLSKLTDKSEAEAVISSDDWKNIFNGDFSLIKNVISSTNNKIGLLLGVKTKGNGTMQQSFYGAHTLRQFTLSSNKADKYKWLHKDLSETKAAGALGNVEFGPEDYQLREFTVKPTQLSIEDMPADEDVFAGQGSAPESSDDDWM